MGGHLSKFRSSAIAVLVVSGALACLTPSALAAGPIPLTASENAAFALLGHSCGGIQQKVYARGFAPDGYPTATDLLSTVCGGSGRGGGHATTYTATASVQWTWFGETLSISPSSGPLEAISSEDAYGDKVYNVGTSAYLETGTPPLHPPAAPTSVTDEVGVYEAGLANVYELMRVYWAPAPATEGLIKTSTVTAVPVNSSAPVTGATVEGWQYMQAPVRVEPNTTYRVTVTNTDAEGTSESSAPIEVTTPNLDGEIQKEHKGPYCTVGSGKVALSPGLTETPAVQTVTVKGTIGECSGGPESASYTTKFTTSGPVTCALLTGAEAIPASTAPLTIKWLPTEEGTSKGTISLSIGQGGISGVSGSASGGPLKTAMSFSIPFWLESFSGAATCGEKIGKKSPKPVKSGTYTTGAIEFE